MPKPIVYQSQKRKKSLSSNQNDGEFIAKLTRNENVAIFDESSNKPIEKGKYIIPTLLYQQKMNDLNELSNFLGVSLKKIDENVFKCSESFFKCSNCNCLSPKSKCHGCLRLLEKNNDICNVLYEFSIEISFFVVLNVTDDHFHAKSHEWQFGCTLFRSMFEDHSNEIDFNVPSNDLMKI